MSHRTRHSLRTRLYGKENERDDSKSPSKRKTDHGEESPVKKPKRKSLQQRRPSEGELPSDDELETLPTDERLPEREREHDELLAYIETTLEAKGSGSLYISGPPGTGKTATLQRILGSRQFAGKLHPVYINCTSIKSVGSVYKKICEELNVRHGATAGGSEKQYQQAIEDYLSRKHRPVILVLDEIDQLSSGKQSILYSIFEWPAQERARLILVGIANALDLTDRLLSRLQARCELKPRIVRFLPYSKQQIVTILKSCLERDGTLELFPEAALGLLAAKVASTSGDIRRALFIARRLLETSKAGGRSNGTTVQIGQVMTVLNQVYGTSQSLSDDLEEAFPLQQKILVCALMLVLQHAKNKDITVGRLHEVYKNICRKRKINAVDQAEFGNLCSLVETRGILRLQGKKELRLQRVCLQWDAEEVNAALNDKQLINDIMADASCLGR